MSSRSSLQAKQCFQCGFEAPADDDQWTTTTHPSLGTVTQCPECSSTNIHSTD